MPMIFDSHAHYDAQAFDADRHDVLASMPEKQVCGIINAASDLPSSRCSIAMAAQYPYIWAAVGIHPEEAANVREEDIQTIQKLAEKSKVVAIGEIGLDYHWEDACPRTIQQKWFRRQLELAKDCGLPVIVHDRDAHDDIGNLLKEFRPAGVVHCFSGSVEMMKEIVKLGMYIGLGGAVTFKNARKPVEVAAAVPLERLLLETDAPYMAPVPMRGKRCDSSLIAYTAARIAEIRGMPVDDLLIQTEKNARTLFGL